MTAQEPITRTESDELYKYDRVITLQQGQRVMNSTNMTESDNSTTRTVSDELYKNRQ